MLKWHTADNNLDSHFIKEAIQIANKHIKNIISHQRNENNHNEIGLYALYGYIMVQFLNWTTLNVGEDVEGPELPYIVHRV